MRSSNLSRPEVPLKAEPSAKLPNTQNAESSADDMEIGRVVNLRLFADDEWSPPSASQIPSLTDRDLTPPPVVSTPLSQKQLTARPQRNVRLPASFVSAESSAASLPSQSSVTHVPLSQSLAPAPNPAQPRLSRADLPPQLAPVGKKARVFVQITSGAVVTSSYGNYRVANSIRDSPNSEPMPPRAAHCCIVACRGPQLQSSRDSRDELIVKKIFARDSSNTLVVPQTAENEIAYSAHCFRFSSFTRCTIKQFGVRRTVARALDVTAAKPVSCDTVARVHDSGAKPLATDVICTRDSAASRAVPCTKPHSALDLTSTRPVSCAHRGIREYLLVTNAQVDTRATSRDAREYNSDRKPRNHYLILNLPSSLHYRRRISRLVSRDYLSPMSLDSIASMLPRFSLSPQSTRSPWKTLAISCKVTALST